MFLLQIALCTGQKGEIKLQGNLTDSHGGWAVYADRLLLGEDLQIQIPGSDPNAHPVRVSLFEISDLDPNDPGRLETSVYRSCADLHPQTTEPKIYVAKGAMA